ncbi:MAG: hypothetical protein AB7G75_02805 [Candidatus Binatia bacterium]
MAPLEILEGTWEELSAHAEQFKGRRLRLIVLPQKTGTPDVSVDEAELRATAIQLFAESDDITREPGKPRSDSQENTFDKIVTEKYQKMGLKL